MISIALFQPDIPQNVGAMMRLCACLGCHLHIIEPCGFPWNDTKIKRAGMDYIDHVKYTKHSSWERFSTEMKDRRIVLMTTHSPSPYIDFRFKEDDILLAGRESAGAPDELHKTLEHRISIPMNAGTRSLNIVNATSMILGEALKQTCWS